MSHKTRCLINVKIGVCRADRDEMKKLYFNGKKRELNFCMVWPSRPGSPHCWHWFCHLRGGHMDQPTLQVRYLSLSFLLLSFMINERKNLIIVEFFFEVPVRKNRAWFTSQCFQSVVTIPYCPCRIPTHVWHCPFKQILYWRFFRGETSNSEDRLEASGSALGKKNWLSPQL